MPFAFFFASFLGFLPNKVTAQLQTRITFIYQELQINTSAARLKDTIQLYVKEPFKPRKLYQNADLGYESFIEFQIDEFCPVEVCKNNECFEIFADSENVEILVNPENFIGSRTLNSPLSDTWRLIGLERERFRDVNTDLFGSDKNPATRNRAIDENYRLYNERMNQFFRDNNRNHIGWNLFLQRYEKYPQNGIQEITDLLSTNISAPSIEAFLAEYQKDKNICSLQAACFSFHLIPFLCLYF